MNRIILIGNGFDLAHGLPTSYTDFIRGYYTIQKLKLLEGESELNDGLCSVKISNPEDRKLMEKFRWMLSNNMLRYVNNVGEITLTEQYNRGCPNNSNSPLFINESRHLTPMGDFSPKHRCVNNFSPSIRQAGCSLSIRLKVLSNAPRSYPLFFRRSLSSNQETYQFYQVPQDRERGCEKTDNHGKEQFEHIIDRPSRQLTLYQTPSND